MSKKNSENNKKNTGSENPPIIASQVVKSPISDEMKKSYLDYAMSVITERALPDVRDGLKPVHRRILFSMNRMNLNPTAKFKKSATVVGDVIGNYHPHGDASVYDAMVKLAQPFSIRYPLVLGQGNFGSIDGDPPAAYRYTEAKMSKLSAELMIDLEKDTVNFRGNFDSTKKEPTVLPATVPNLLLNGTLGIAVGMASNIPPHNIGEIIDATVQLIDNPKSNTEDLLQFVKGPDFPTGGLAFDKKSIHAAYASGRGGVVTRGEAEIIEDSSGMSQIVITSIPFRVNKSDLIIKIAELHSQKKVDGIKGLRDESTDEIRIVIDIKSSAHPQSILNYIYKHTQLEETFHYNMVALVDGVPQTLGLKSILEQFVKHRFEIVTRRTKFELSKAKAREHILLGLKKALDHIDEIIKIIKASKDTVVAHLNLMKRFKFSELQATAILEMKLQKLAGLERKKIEDELLQLQKFISELEELLKSNTKMRNLIKKELIDIRNKYSDDRRTKIIPGGVKNISIEDIIPDEESVLVLTNGGYIKRTNPDEYKKQRRGGVGVIDLDTKEEDFVSKLIYTNTHSDLLFFTNKGKVYQIKMYDIPEGRKATKGKSIANFLSISADESITSVLAMSSELKKTNELSVMLMTENGIVKKVAAESFHDVRRNGIIAIKLKDSDKLVSAHFVAKSDDVVVVTTNGQSIRFKESDIREMGRGAAGVRGINISKDSVVCSLTVKKEYKNDNLMVFSANGYGKQTPLDEYKVQKRGGSGIKTAKVTDKIGKIISAAIVTENTDEVVAMSKKGQVIRIDIDEIPILGRQTQGVRVMKLRDADHIASLVTF
ncbi:MAG TPA: DNA gyrase subunit A [Candidatus Paceibacterota bacterium]|nr:DNA gyrase subunit A [Candidatus Paceibacterota bacterium]